MSEFHVKVITIDKIGKHPNADTLSITQVLGNYPVIFRTGEFSPGDRAVYIPVDSLVPLDDERFSWLKETNAKPLSVDSNNPLLPKTHARIRAKKLRSIFSMGILTKADPSWEDGQDVRTELNIHKWEPAIPWFSQGEVEATPGFFPIYTDLEGLRRWPNILKQNETVVITEKLHGSNGRWAWHQDRFWCGSHRTVKKENYDILWWKVAKQYNLVEKLRDLAPHKIFYGEIYGQVQDLKYGAKTNELFIAIFDIYDIETGQYMEYGDVEAICERLSLPTAPLLYHGPWSEELQSYAEGPTTVPTAKRGHVREGFVVRTVPKRYDDNVGRAILKLVGEGYLTRREDDA